MIERRKGSRRTADRRPASAKTGFLLASAVFAVVLYSLLFRVTGAERQGCERLDTTRIAIYEVLTEAEQGLRTQGVASEDPELRRLQIERADAYAEITRELVDSTAEYAEEPGSPRIDCADAYPRPWPFH